MDGLDYLLDVDVFRVGNLMGDHIERGAEEHFGQETDWQVGTEFTALDPLFEYLGCLRDADVASAVGDSVDHAVDRAVVDQELEHRSIFDDAAEPSLNDQSKFFVCRRRLLHHFFRLHLDRVDGLSIDEVEQVVLVLEMVVDAAFCDAGRFGNAFHRKSADALLGKHGKHRFVDVVSNHRVNGSLGRWGRSGHVFHLQIFL